MHCRIKHLAGILGLSTLAACTTGGGCEGMSPLPNGFNKQQRIENAASVRLTDSGLAFVAANVGSLAARLLEDQGLVQGGVIRFPIPETVIDESAFSGTICPDGPDDATDRCIAELDFANAHLTLTTANPTSVVVSGPLPIRLKNLPIDGEAIGFIPVEATAALSGGGNGECDPGSMSFKEVEANAEVAIEVDRDPAHTGREGYSKIRVVKVEINQEQLIDGLHFCGGTWQEAIINALKGVVGDMLISGFTGTIIDTVNEQLCLPADTTLPNPCPAGSTNDNGVCRYSDGSCPSMLLGLDGHIDLSPALASISPGTKGALDFLLAVGGSNPRDDDPAQAWGDLNPVGGGATLGLLGGVEPSPVSTCVLPASVTFPKNIPIPNELLGNSLPNWQGEGPHAGVALSERFLNYALGSAYNSGLLCISVTTDQVPMLSSGLFALLVPSIKYLAHQKKAVPLQIIVRPQQPPTITVGNGTDMVDDPLLRVGLEQAIIDLYIWSSDRYVRAFTAQFDLDVPIGLDISGQTLTPQLDKIYVQNGLVTHSSLVQEDPATIASALEGVIEGIAGQLTGALPSIDLSTMLEPFGLSLVLQKQGIRKLTKGNDAFLGVFAAMQVASQTTALEVDTQAQLVRKNLDKAGFRLATASDNNRPTLLVRAQSSSAEPVEYSYRLDNGYWHPWTTQSELLVDDAFLLMQGHHELAVKARVVGQPATEDRSPATIAFTIDVDEPRTQLHVTGNQVKVESWDIVSANDKLLARYRFDDGAYSAWQAVTVLESIEAPASARTIVVEVQDEEGNVASTSHVLHGSAAPDEVLERAEASGCGCTVPGSGSRSSAYGWLAGAGLIAALIGANKRRRARAAAQALGSAALVAVAGSVTGCGGDENATVIPMPAEQPDGGSDAATEDGTNGELLVLKPGLIGSYTSAAAASDDTIWVSGYNEADYENEVQYGDLVVGKWTGEAVEWETVDGIPADAQPDPSLYDVEKSWRKGIASAGPDVGMWSTLVLNDQGQPRVAYYDATRKALRFASYEAGAWKVSDVYAKTGVEAGRYAKMLMVGGMPVVAFQAIEGKSGFASSKVLLAKATKAVPAGPADWTIEEVAVNDQTPCRAHLCPTGEKCVAETLQCAPTTNGCNPKCSSGTACIADSCETILDGTKLDAYPAAIGNYVAIAAAADGTIGVVYYDAIAGSLMQAHKDTSGWVTAVLDSGNVGPGASLAIDSAGNWHVSYVDLANRVLKYLQVHGGEQVLGSEVVDDGNGIGGTPFGDGKHVVGDDSHLTLSSSGDVRIAYQDATDGSLRFAVGVASSGAARTWTVQRLEQPEFAGFFPQQVVTSAGTQIINWWRKSKPSVEGNVLLVKP